MVHLQRFHITPFSYLIKIVWIFPAVCKSLKLYNLFGVFKSCVCFMRSETCFSCGLQSQQWPFMTQRCSLRKRGDLRMGSFCCSWYCRAYVLNPGLIYSQVNNFSIPRNKRWKDPPRASHFVNLVRGHALSSLSFVFLKWLKWRGCTRCFDLFSPAAWSGAGVFQSLSSLFLVRKAVFQWGGKVWRRATLVSPI